MSPLLPQIPAPSINALLLTCRTPAHPVRPDSCMSTGAVPPQNPGTEALLWAAASFYYKPSHTTLPSPPPDSSRAPLSSDWDPESSSEPGADTFGCVPTVCGCVCVCVCVSPTSLQFPTLQLQFTHKALPWNTRQESGVPAGFRTRFSAFTGVSATQEGPRSAFFTCPLPPADVPIPRLH